MPNDQSWNVATARVAANISLSAAYVELATPQITATAADSSSISIALTVPSPNSVSYTIERSLNGVDWAELVTDVLPGEFPYTDPSLSAETEYFYRAFAKDATDTSNYSAPSSDTTEAATAPVASGWRANEPAGLVSWPELTFENNQIQSGFTDHDTANLEYITDATSPAPGDAVGRIWYPENDAGGNSTINIGNPGNTVVKNQVYACIALRMDPDFQYHLTGSNKIFFINCKGYGGGGDPYIFIINSDTSPAQGRGELQGTPSGAVQWPPNAGAEMLKGEWYVIEVNLILNSPGNADGIYEQWVHRISTDEVFKTHDFSDVEYVNSGYDLELPGILNIWGGLGDTVTVPGGFYLDCGGFYMSYKAAS